MKDHITRSLSSSEVCPRIKLGLRQRENSTVSLASVVGNKADNGSVGKPDDNRNAEKKIVSNNQNTSVSTPLSKEFIASRKWINSSFHHMRWVVIFTTGVGLFLSIFARLSITVAIIDMVKQTHVPVHYQHVNHTNASVIDKLEEVFEDEVFLYDWDNTVQIFLMTIYLIAYGLLQVPASIHIEKKGGHKITACNQIIALVATACIPHIAHYGWEWVAVLRAIVGAAHAGIFAIGVHMVDVWIPVKEKSMGVTFVQFIGCAGVVFNPLMSGYLTAINWTFTFYTPSLLSFIWVLIWLVIVRDKPEDCWLISQQELLLIKNNNDYRKQVDNSNPDSDKEEKFPWKKVFKTPCVYGFLFIWIVHSCTNQGFILILSRYLMSNGIGVDDISENGVTTFYILSGSLVSFIWGFLVLSFLLDHNVSKINARRLVFTISCCSSAIALILPSFIEGNPFWMCLLNRIAQPVADVIIIGSVMDNFSEAGISTSVFGIINTMGSCSNLPVGIIIGQALDYYEESLVCWHLILSTMSLATIATLICYFLMIDSVPVRFTDNKKNLTDLEKNIDHYFIDCNNKENSV